MKNQENLLDTLILDEKECARYLGYGTQMPDEKIRAMIQECEVLLKKTAKPRSLYRIFPICEQKEGILLEGTTLCLEGNAIREHLAGCSHVILLCATLSHEIDRKEKQLQISDMAKALVFNAAAVTIIEQICDEIEKQILEQICGKMGTQIFGDCETFQEQSERKYFLTSRFGFGYGDLPLVQEREALSILGTEKRIGVSIGENLLMSPKKSVACVIGIGNGQAVEKKSGCAFCSLKGKCDYSCQKKWQKD